MFDIYVFSHAEIDLRFSINVTTASVGLEPTLSASKTDVLPVRRQGNALAKGDSFSVISNGD